MQLEKLNNNQLCKLTDYSKSIFKMTVFNVLSKDVMVLITLTRPGLGQGRGSQNAHRQWIVLCLTLLSCDCTNRVQWCIFQHEEFSISKSLQLEDALY